MQHFIGFIALLYWNSANQLHEQKGTNQIAHRIVV